MNVEDRKREFGDDGPAEVTVDPKAFFKGKEFIPSRMGERLQRQGQLRLGHDRALWRYDHGVYLRGGDEWVKAEVREVLGERYRRRHADETLSWLHATLPSIGETPPERWINVRNGLLDWRTGELCPHSPDIPTTVQIPVEWHPDARCPRFEQFLGEVLPDDAAGFALEVIGYALYSGNPLRKALLLLGPGRNGKSVFLDATSELLGTDNVSAVPLQFLAENRFAAAELYGRLANISGDLDARAIKRTDIFKMLTGGDPFMAERKYGQPFTFRTFAFPMFSANEAPISSDQSDAWFDRWLILPMEQRIDESKQDPHLRAKLTTDAELQGLLVLAVSALRRLMERGRFDEPKSVHMAGSRYRDRLDTVRGFVDDECRFGPGEWVDKTTLYRDYKAWAQEGGRLALSAATFNDHLLRAFGQSISEARSKSRKVWRGICSVTPDLLRDRPAATEATEATDFPTPVQNKNDFREGVGNESLQSLQSLPDAIGAVAESHPNGVVTDLAGLRRLAEGEATECVRASCRAPGTHTSELTGRPACELHWKFSA